MSAAPGPKATLDDWLQWLPGLSQAAIDLGLDRVATVYERMRLPRPARVLTVAGTNGKGSSVMMLEAMLAKRGERVGAYTSPHILCYEERIRVDRKPADAAAIVAAFAAVEKVRGDVRLTYFEYGTLAALKVFASSGVDAVVLEVGLGGRLDAVNIVEHDGCLITNVSMDHSDWLGDSIGAIAREKAGVMRRGRPAVFGAKEPPPEIRDAARQSGAELRVAGEDFSWQRDADGRWAWRGTGSSLTGLELPSLAGAHQIVNAAGVLALLEAVGLDDLLDRETVNTALTRLEFAGRQQILSRRGRRWLLDGAHNAAGAQTLADAIPAHAAGSDVVIVLGILRDKDAESIIRSLSSQVARIITLTPETERAIPADTLAGIARRVAAAAVESAKSPAAAFESAVTSSRDGDLIVVAGSFYTLELALRWLGHTAQ